MMKYQYGRTQTLMTDFTNIDYERERERESPNIVDKCNDL